MKKITLLILFACSVLSSCSNNKAVSYESAHDTEQESTVVSTTVTEAEAFTTETVKTTEKKRTQTTYGDEITYDVYSDAISADELYNVEKIEMPDSIDGMKYNICDYNDGKIVLGLIKEQNADTYVCDYGTYDYKSSSYEPLITDLSDAYCIASYKNYYFFIISENDTIESLKVYNSDTNQLITVYNSMDECSLKEYKLAFCDEKCYFTTYTSSERNNSRIYEYDMVTDKLIVYIENAMMTRTSGKNVFYASYESGAKKCNKLVNKKSGDIFDIHNEDIMDYVCCGDRAYAIINGDISDIHDTYEIIKEIKPTSGDNILASKEGFGEIFNDMSSNEFCIGWYDITGIESEPCVYDVKNEVIAVFGNIPRCYYRTYLDDNAGLIFDEMNFHNTHQLYLFEPKE